jgi:RNA polymerase sigma-70 factor (ECF subfamily)
MAFLVLLESLTPVERAVFLLRELFDYGYDEIAGIVDLTEDNCRQLYVRARLRAAHVNGQPGVMFVDDEGRIGAVMSVDVADGLVQTIRGITNPDKLEHLGPVLDAREICAGIAADVGRVLDSRRAHRATR